MTEELLKKIKKEAEEKIETLDEFNEYARLRNRLALIEEAKKILGLPYNRDMHLPEKTEAGIIMSTYQKYISQIEEKDTNGIYVYIGTYMPSEFSYEEFEEGYPLEIETKFNDPRATHRHYWNLEGIWSESINIQDCEEFEKNHTVLYVDNFYDLQKEFITTAIKESQQAAVIKVLKKYK